jgi:hypothetical protein
MPDEFRPDRCGFIVQSALVGDDVMQLAVDWRRMREKPRLLERMRRFTDIVNRGGISVVWIGPDDRVQGALAPGHTDEILLQAVKEATAAGIIVDLSA